MGDQGEKTNPVEREGDPPKSSPGEGLVLGQDTWLVTEAVPTGYAAAEVLKPRCFDFPFSLKIKIKKL